MKQLLLTMFGLVFAASVAQGQGLTQAQCNTLSTDILTTHAAEFADAIATGDVTTVAAAYRQVASPDFIVWKTSVTSDEYRGAIVWTEVDTLSVGDARIFEWLTGQLVLPLNAADANVRQGIADTFGSGTTTRANLLAVAKRQALRSEKLFATGTGSMATPGFVVYEGPISLTDMARAMPTNRCSE